MPKPYTRNYQATIDDVYDDILNLYRYYRTERRQKMLDWLWSLKKADHKEWGKRGPHRDEDNQRMNDWLQWRTSLEFKDWAPPPRTRDERLLYMYHAHLHKYRLDGERAPAECAKRDVMKKFEMKREAVVRALSRERKRQIKAGRYPDGRLTNLAGRTWAKDAAASIAPVTDDDGPIPFETSGGTF